jgi:hypothetical protein
MPLYCLLLLMVGVYGTKRLKAFLAAGGGSWVDGYSYHFYLNDQSPEWEIPRVYAAIQSVLRSYKQNDKPVFNTEIGFLTGGAQKSVVAKFASGPLSVVLDDADAAGLMARSVILSFSVGINSVYWFAWDSYSMGMTTDQRGGTPNAVGRAYGELYGWLNGAVLEGCHRYTGLIWLCSINRNGSGEIVIWSTEKVNFSLPRKSGVFREIVSLDGDVSPYRDGSSISIGPSPMLLR